MKKQKGILFDLDGVIFQGNRLIPGAKKTLQLIREADIPFRFITNTTRMTKKSLIDMLDSMGLSINSQEIFAAPHAAAEYCKINNYKSIALIVPEKNMEEDFKDFNLTYNNPEAVVLGDMGNLFTFEILNKIFELILNGAELIAMHKNKYWNSSSGIKLDLGAFVSALEFSSGKKAVVIGKPNPYLFNLAIHSWNISKDLIYVVGDDIESDIGGACNSGMKSILVKTGKFIEENLASSSIKPDYIINSINDLNKIIKLK